MKYKRKVGTTISFELKGFDELQNSLHDLADKVESLGGEHEVTFEELFVQEFMISHTNFSTFNELLNSSPFEVNSSEDFAAIPDAAFDQYISEVTNFDSWGNMLEEASCEYAARQLGF